MDSEIYNENPTNQNENPNQFITECKKCFENNPYYENICPPQCLYTLHGEGIPLVIEESFQGKCPSVAQPYFIISYGPAGSGKSDSLDFIKSMRDVNLINITETNTIDVNVDNVFQKGSLGNRYITARDTLGTDIVKKQRLYYKYRWLADQISDNILNIALLEKYNVKWETTGNDIEWTQKEIARIKSYGYKVLVVMPLVSKKTLMLRLENRTCQEATPEGGLEEKRKNAMINIKHLIKDECLQCRRSNPLVNIIVSKLIDNVKCLDCKPDRFIIFDNNKEKVDRKVVFDSLDSSNMTYLENLNEYLKNNEEDINMLNGLTR